MMRWTKEREKAIKLHRKAARHYAYAMELMLRDRPTAASRAFRACLLARQKAWRLDPESHLFS
jgi:hypothetical protein